MDASRRLTSLDAFRGIIIAGMIVVTDPGTYSAVYPQLLHAAWGGATATDMIFPCFLFMVGFAIPLSFAARLGRGEDRRHIALHLLYRTVFLFALGLALNGFPEYKLATLRLAGILQRIAVCYFAGGLLYLFTKPFGNQGHLYRLGAVTLMLLAGYALLLLMVPVPGIGAGHLDSYGALPAYIDRKILTTPHLWVWGLTPGKGVTYDPEGILSTLPAIASTLIGVMSGKWWLQSTLAPGKKALRLGLIGLGLVIAGLLLHPYLPIIKRIWTPSFGLLSSGVALVSFTLLYAITDIRGYRKWSSPFLVLGSNAILAFIISTLITDIADLVHLQVAGKSVTLHEYGDELCLRTGMSPVNASLLYALMIVVLNMLILLPLYRKKIFVKI